MSADRVPLFLREAVVTLYPATAGGQIAAGSGVWWSGPARDLVLEGRLTGVLSAASGDAYYTEHQVTEEHHIEIGSVWVTRRADQRDFQLARGNNYVLQIVWQAPGPPGNLLKVRTYFGVTAQAWRLGTAGTNEAVQRLVLRAQYAAESGPAAVPGAGGAGTVQVPALPLGYGGAAGTEEAVGYFHEAPYFPGTYFLGVYAWPVAVYLEQATAAGLASQGTGVTLGLEVNGSLTGDVINLPSGAAGATVTGTANLNLRPVPANTPVRWKVTAGPADGESAGWQGYLGMNVRVGA